MVRLILAAMGAMLATTATAEMQTRTLDYAVDGVEFSSTLVWDASVPGPRAGLVLVPNWMGATESAVDKAKEIAGTRYAILVADVYGRDVRPANAGEAGQAARAMYADRPALRARAAKALEVLAAQSEVDGQRLGAIGFCFGGATVLEMARAGIDGLAGVVSFHGNLSTELPAEKGKIKAPILVLNGAADPLVPAAQIAGFQAEMDAAGADWTFVNYAGAVHCLAESDAASPPNCVYDARAAARAYRAMNDFLDERFAAAR
jgi:dienelactone hydrolase